MPEILSLNNFHLAKNGVRLTYGDTTVYNLHLDQAIGGTITANRMSGNRGDVVTLYNNPSAGYSFDNYSVTGSTLTGVQVRFNREDIYVAPSFTHNVYNINLQQTTGGTITSDKSTGYYGDTVTLSNTPAEHYGFRDYSITGATLTGNQFTINESNVTAKANFSAWPVRNVSIQQRTGGTIASNKSTGYDGDVVTLSNTADTGYTFTNYNVTGATLTGNQFAFNGGNVTAQGAFNHNVYNLTLQQTSGGTITADKTTGYYGDTVTLSSNVEQGYIFEGYEITGSTLTGNQFKFNTNDVTVKGNIIYPVTKVLSDYGNTVLTSKSYDYGYDLNIPDEDDLNYITITYTTYERSSVSTTEQTYWDYFELYDKDLNHIWQHEAQSQKADAFLYRIYHSVVMLNDYIDSWTSEESLQKYLKYDSYSKRYYYYSVYGSNNINPWVGMWFGDTSKQKIKYVFDRANRLCYFYIDDILFGYAHLTIDPIIIKSMGAFHGTFVRPFTYYKLKAAMFNNLQTAIAWG